MKNIPLSFIVLLAYITSTLYLAIHFHPLWSLFYIFIFIGTVADLITMSTNGNILFIRTIWFLITGRIKRVNTQFGRYYITNRNTSNHVQLIELYDKFFYMKEIGSHPYQDTESLKAWIKAIYDKKYQEKEAISSKEKEIKRWNGYIDLQHERDSKIKDMVS